MDDLITMSAKCTEKLQTVEGYMVHLVLEEGQGLARDLIMDCWTDVEISAQFDFKTAYEVVVRRKG